uniref:Serpentine receptor class gamma n=1 Tax=Strongyloides venezuelensis TaxID=75913 RepID=A0A0K0FTM7_STRVS
MHLFDKPKKITYWGYFCEYFKEHEWGAIAYKFLFFQTITLTISGNIIISINRFYALYSPINYPRIWNHRLAIIIVLCQIIVCYLAYTHILYTKTALLYDHSTNSSQFTTPDKNFSLANNGVLLSFCVVGIIITGILNLKIFKKFNRIFNKMDSGKYGSKLAMISFMVLATFFLIITAVQISVRFYAIKTQNSVLKNIINEYFFYSIPILNTLQPYLLLFLSNQLRKGIMKFLCAIINRNKVINIKTSFFYKDDLRIRRK